LAGAGVDIRKWPQRKKAELLLGVPPARFNALEIAGKLKTYVDLRGRRRYDPQVLARLREEHAREVFRHFAGRPAAKPGGEKAAAIFEDFKARVGLREIVIKHQVAPEHVTELRRQYAAMGDDLLIGAAEVLELRELLDWQGTDGRTLVDAVNARLRYQFQRGRSLAAEDRTPPTEGIRDAVDAADEREATT
jgi:hypothetical protein